MQIRNFKSLLWLCLVIAPFSLRAEIVTITVRAGVNGGGQETLTVETNQTAELISSDTGAVYFSKPVSPNREFPMDMPGFTIIGRTWDSFGAPIVVGPAAIKVVARELVASHATFRISPQAFAPEKTVIVPHLSNGATVALQVSSNLVDWVTTTNGAYSGTNGALFFRINLERAP